MIKKLYQAYIHLGPREDLVLTLEVVARAGEGGASLARQADTLLVVCRDELVVCDALEDAATAVQAVQCS